MWKNGGSCETPVKMSSFPPFRHVPARAKKAGMLAKAID
ncbi:hypothetical protein B4099_3399 [Heyndrickxia coagulans]|uniref:Uncharacterized protein n=1 Tax=Heyndrickxia coagulans TaxID=1398 RepID=A0A150JQ11_HEYCO|nr:hypothetical protein B4099_3399 [Heyndrickxia coagulans]